MKEEHHSSSSKEKLSRKSVHAIRATLNQKNILLRASGSAEQKRALRIQNIQAEILSTESSYLEQLNKIITNYMNPMLENKLITPRSPAERSIFANIRVIEQIHQKVLFDIRAVHSKEGFQEGLIANQFLELIPYLTLYHEYVTLFDEGTSFIREMTKDVKQAIKFEEVCSTRNHRASRLQLNSLRIAPIQRITRYVLLFQDLVKHTTEEYSDHRSFVKICEAMKQQTEKLEQIRVNEENKRTLSKVNQKLVHRENVLLIYTLLVYKKKLPSCGKRGTLLVASRHLILSEHVLCCTGTKIPDYQQVLLFSDCVVVISNFESEEPEILSAIRWISYTMSRTFQYGQEGRQITLINPRGPRLARLLLLGYSVLKSIQGSQTNLSSSWSRPQEYLKSIKSSTNLKEKLESKRDQTLSSSFAFDDNLDLTASIVIALDTQFSISSAVPVDVEGQIDLVYSINIIQQFSNRTIMRRFLDFHCLYDSIRNIDAYKSKELPLLPPLAGPAKEMPSQATIQQQCRSLEVFLNELALLDPPILNNKDIKGFFEDDMSCDSLMDSCESEGLNVDIVDLAFLRSSMADGYLNEALDDLYQSSPHPFQSDELEEREIHSNTH